MNNYQVISSNLQLYWRVFLGKNPKITFVFQLLYKFLFIHLSVARVSPHCPHKTGGHLHYLPLTAVVLPVQDTGGWSGGMELLEIFTEKERSREHPNLERSYKRLTSKEGQIGTLSWPGQQQDPPSPKYFPLHHMLSPLFLNCIS